MSKASSSRKASAKLNGARSTPRRKSTTLTVEAQVSPLAEPIAWQHAIGLAEPLALWRQLQQRDQLPQVLLLTGRSGIGKRLALAALAAQIECPTGDACGHCPSCSTLLQGQHPEVLWLEPPASRVYLKDDAERVLEHLRYQPECGGQERIVVIVDADCLSHVAANRLLKTLEEPPAGARLLLSTSRFDALLDTIRSRCVRWRMLPPPLASTLSWLQQQLGASCPDPCRLEAIVREAGLSPGLALAAARRSSTERPALARPLWRAADPLAALEAAAQAAASASKAQGGGGLAACLQEWELDLNAYYREQWAKPEGARASELGPTLLAQRRQILRQMRALAGRGQVALSPLLSAESLALTALGVTTP